MMRASLSILFIAALAACAGSPVQDPFITEHRVWPEPPAAKRIAFLGEFSNSSDLGIRESAWARLVSLTAGRRSDAMLRPMAIAASSDGRVLFVADPDTRCVHRYDLDRSRYDCLTVGRNEALVSPIALAVSDDGRLFVSDSRLARIFQAPIDGKRLEPFETSASLRQPTGIAWDTELASLLVTDTGTQTVKVFDAAGRLVREIGGRGDAPGLFNFPTYLWIDPGRDILVTDSLNFRIQRFGSDGEFLHGFGENGDRVGDFARPKGIATDSHGHVYVIDGLMNALQVFSPEGIFLMSIGTQGHEPGQFWLPNGIFVAQDDTIFVADSYNRRVQVFRYVGPGQ